MPEYKYDVFISYAHEDQKFAKKLAEALRGNRVDVWFDDFEILPGDNIPIKVGKGIDQSRKMILIATPIYFKKKYPEGEFSTKLDEDPNGQNRSLIPLVLEKCDFPALIRSKAYIDFSEDADFDLKLRALIEALDIEEKEASRDEEEGRF